MRKEFEHETATAAVRHHGGGLASLVNMFSRTRRKGHATALMQKVVDYADEQHLTLMLVAQRHSITTGLNDEQLVEFYKKFGFRVRDNTLPVVMERPVKGTIDTLS